MASATPPNSADAARLEGEAPRFVYPHPLTAEELADMDRVLPHRPAEEILAWIEGDGPDPWAESSG